MSLKDDKMSIWGQWPAVCLYMKRLCKKSPGNTAPAVPQTGTI